MAQFGYYLVTAVQDVPEPCRVEEVMPIVGALFFLNGLVGIQSWRNCCRRGPWRIVQK